MLMIRGVAVADVSAGAVGATGGQDSSTFFSVVFSTNSLINLMKKQHKKG